MEGVFSDAHLKLHLNTQHHFLSHFMMARFTFLLILLYFFTKVKSEKYVCTLNQTVELEGDSIAFLETPEFPRLVLDSEKNSCFYKFTKLLSGNETTMVNC